MIFAWAFHGSCDTDCQLNSNLFEMEWPPASGQIQHFPEFDRIAFYDMYAARQKIELV